MISKIRFRYAAALLCVLALVSLLLPTVFAVGETVSVTGVNGVTVGADDKGTVSESGGTVTITASGSFTSAKTATVTVTNNSGSTATISFDYSAKQVSQCSLGTVTSNSCSGHHSELLTNGNSFSFTFRTRSWNTNTTATMTLSNFTVEAVAAESNVTVTYGSLGSVTMDGTTIASGSVNSVSSSTGATFVAVPGSGNKFVAWIDPTSNGVLSTASTYQLLPTQDMEVKAVFTNASCEPCLWASNKAYLFESLSAALGHAATATNKTIVLASDGTLPAGDHIIPAGVNLVIPYDSNDDGTFGEKPDAFVNSGGAATTAYRTLTLKSGANLVVTGSLNVNGKVRTFTNRDTGCVSGTYGQLILSDNSSVTISGSLYCYGYITGTGTVTANANSNVYELLQLRDWVGGSTASEWAANSFFFSQYYVQNIEAPYTIHAGALSHAAMSIYVASFVKSIYQDTTVFIGESSGLIQITEGSITRTYNAVDDRIEYTLNSGADVKAKNITVTIKTGISLVDPEYDTSDYIMGLNNRMSIYVASGSQLSVENDFKMLPGMEVYIEEGATAEVASNCKLYLYDEADWYDKYTLWKNWTSSASDIFAGHEISNHTVRFSPTRGAATKTNSGSAKLVVDGTLKIHGNVFTTAGSTNKMNDNAVIEDPKSVDKIVTGTGRIENDSTWGTGTLTETNAWFNDASDNYEATINTIPVVAKLAGITDGSTYVYNSLAAGTADAPTIYYGTENDGWYNYLVTAVDSSGNSAVSFVDVVDSAESSNHTVSRYVSATDTTPAYREDIPDVVGYVTYDSAGTQSAFSFTAQHHADATGSGTLSLNSLGGTDWTYTLKEVNADTTLTLDVCSVILSALNVRYDSEIMLQFKFFLPPDLVSNGAVITLTKPDPWTENETISERFDASNWLYEKDAGRYVVEMGIASGEMTRDVTITVEDSEGIAHNIYRYSNGTIIDTPAYSVQDYASIIFGQDSQEDKDMATKLLVYGGYAQGWFDVVNDGDPAYSILTSVPLLDGVTADTIVSRLHKVESLDGIKATAIEPFLDSDIYLRIKFTLSEGESIADYTFTVNGPDGSVTIPGAEAKRDGTRYYVDILHIPAALLDKGYTVTVSKEGTSETYSVTASVTDWVRIIIGSTNATDEQKNMAKALYLYNQQAKDYFKIEDA